MKTRTRRLLASVATLSLGLGGAIVASAPAYAAGFVVSNSNDTGAGSLNQAITDANANPGADTITFTITGTIQISTDLPRITDSLTITGPGSGLLTIEDAADNLYEGIFTYNGSTTVDSVTVSGLSLSGFEYALDFDNTAVITLTDVAVSGARNNALYVVSGALTVSNSHFDGNDSTAGDISIGSGDSATIIDSTFSNNDGNGLTLDLSGSATATVSASTADNNSDSGFTLYTEDTASLNVASVSAAGNGNYGLNTEGEGGEITIADSTFSANGFSNILGDLESDSSLTLSNIAVEGSAGGSGATFLVDESTLSITASRFTGNNIGGSATLGGGAAIFASNSATVTVATSVFSGNESTGAGGGLALAGSAGATFILDTLTVDGNTAQTSGGGILTTYDDATSSLTITDSTISGNTSDEDGGGIAVDSAGGNLTVANSTIAGNSAAGAGAAVRYATTAAANFLLSNSTVSGNTGTTGGAVDIDAAAVLTVSDSVIANSTGVDDLVTNGATVTVNYSLVEDPDTAAAARLAAGTGNLTGVDPQLGPLANNGGTTLTMLPAAASPVIGAGSPGSTSALATDQRGLARVSGPRIDIGSVEVQAVLAATGSNDPTAPFLGGALLAFAGILLLVVRRRRTA